MIGAAARAFVEIRARARRGSALGRWRRYPVRILMIRAFARRGASARYELRFQIR